MVGLRGAWRSGRILQLLAARGLPRDTPASLRLASAADVGVRRQRPCRHRGHRFPAARLRGRRPALAGPRRRRARCRHAGQVRAGRDRAGALSAVGLAPAGRLCRDRSSCSTCPISAPAPKVLGFLADYVSEEGFDAGIGHLPVARARAILPAARAAPCVLLSRPRPRSWRRSRCRVACARSKPRRRSCRRDDCSPYVFARADLAALRLVLRLARSVPVLLSRRRR